MEFQAEIIRAIQTVSSPALDVIFQVITFFGEQFFFIPVMMLIFWCVNKELGYWICWSLCTGNLATNSVKGIFKVERPIGYEGIRTLRAETATGYSFPSGHTQSAANFFTALARAVNRKRFWVLAFVVPLLVGVSRLYLGCHWPMDVAASYVFGIALPLVLWLVYRKFAHHKEALFLVSALIFTPFCLMQGDIADFWKSFGLAIGLAVGAYIETKYVRFETEVSFKKKALRFAIGLPVILLVYVPMKLLLPEGNIVAFVRYFCVAVTAVAIWPAIFRKLDF